MLSALVPRGRVIAVTRYADDPGVSNVVGFYPASAYRIVQNTLERMLALRPDLVCVAEFSSADFLAQIQDTGLPTHRYATPGGYADIRAGLLALGERVGEPARARTLVATLDQRLEQLAQRLTSATRRPRVLYWTAGRAAGSGTTLGEMIERAGARNAAAEAKVAGFTEISAERVYAIDPDVLLRSTWDGDHPADHGLPPELGSLRAVREHAVVELPSRVLSTVSQYFVDGVEALARALHPECFK